MNIPLKPKPGLSGPPANRDKTWQWEGLGDRAILRLMDEYDDHSDQESDIEELRQRLDELENRADGGGSDVAAAIVPYILGSCLAMILSWSRNGSILYCIGHGLASWIYVIYFAFTR